MNLVWTVDLARRINGSGVGVFAADPGVADTGTHRDYPWPLPARAVMRLARPLLHRLLSPHKAAVSSIRAASASELEGTTCLMLDRKGQPVDMPESALSAVNAEVVDRISRELAHLERQDMDATSGKC